MGLSRLALKRTEGASGIRVQSQCKYLIDEAGADLGLGFDRDLSIAGRAMVKAENGDYLQKLIKINRPSIDSAVSPCGCLLLIRRCSPSHSHPRHSPRSPGDICLQQRDAIISNRWSCCCRTQPSRGGRRRCEYECPSYGNWS